MRRVFLIAGLVALTVLGSVYVMTYAVPGTPQDFDPGPVPSTIPVTSFKDCIETGNVVLKGYPRQCRTRDGKQFIENIGNEIEKANLIWIDTPRPNSIIKDPLTIRGEARGIWFFEATFPLVLTDSDGLIIAEGFAQARPPAGGDWMTEDFIPFTGTLTFTASALGDRGALILRKGNPSGLPQRDDALSVPVMFEPADLTSVTVPVTPPAYERCVVTGCSGQVCAAEARITTCEYREEYACYDVAICEVQTDGRCGWTETPEIVACLVAATPTP